MTNILGLPQRYEDTTELGSGGMGKVYKAHDKTLAKFVAIKILHSTTNDQNDKVLRFQQEAKAAGKLQHPNIVTTLNFGITDNGNPFLVMDLIEGQTLNEWLKENSNFEDTIELLIQTTRALEHAHERGVVHRDLKPANIVIESDSSKNPIAKVIDFGIAYLEDNSNKLTKANAILGSPLYMSPEQIDGQESDKRSDLYSFGCIIFECLAGSPPFRGNSAVETMQMHKSSLPPSIGSLGTTELSDDIQTTVQAIVTKALKKNKEDRYQSANQLKTDLEELLSIYESEQSELRRQENIEQEKSFVPSLQSIKKQKTKTFTAIVLVAAILSSLAFIYISIQSDKHPLKVVDSLDQKHVEYEPYLETSEKHWIYPAQDNSKIKWTTTHPQITDEKFAVVRNTKLSLRRLDLKSSIHLTAEGFKHLEGLQVNEIKLGERKLNKDTVRALSKVKNLKVIRLIVVELESGCFEPMQNYKELVNLSTKYCLFNNGSIASIAPIKALRFLILRGAEGITEEDLATLAKAKQLEQLSVRQCIVGEKPKDFHGVSGHLSSNIVKELAKLNVSELDISDTDVTDKDILKLTKMKNLEVLKLYKCINITKAGLAKFRSKNKKVKFIVDKYNKLI